MYIWRKKNEKRIQGGIFAYSGYSPEEKHKKKTKKKNELQLPSTACNAEKHGKLLSIVVLTYIHRTQVGQQGLFCIQDVDLVKALFAKK